MIVFLNGMRRLFSRPT